ncbi:MAG TPA: trypsin-like peptidase domain-containing protein [Acidimicrobiales bacterium]|nr:trypsin-like peptidase domain-containing protein [Acidimicrobiales bacterium]
MDPRPGPSDSPEGEPRPDDAADDADLAFDDDGPFFAWLPPEDRLWRHPSEGLRGGAAPGTSRRSPAVLRMARTTLSSTWAIALVAGLIGAGAATGVGVASGLWPRQTTVVRPALESTSAVSFTDTNGEPTKWTSIDDSVAPSVVGLTVAGPTGPSVGSGVVLLDADGDQTFVVTDSSLFGSSQLAGYSATATVTFLSGQAYKARLLNEDTQSGIAVLEVDSYMNAVPAQIGSVSEIDQADPVLAVGSRSVPSVAPGTISGEDRAVPMTNGSTLDNLMAVTMPPMSATADGGPLLDQYGRVVGITLDVNPMDNSDQQFTFAVPIDEVTHVANQIVDGDTVTHPWLGISDATDLPSEMAHQLGLMGGVQAGAVEPGSPAESAGLRADDIVTAIDGKAVTSAGALIADISTCVPGRTVPITYLSGDRTVQTTIRMGDQPGG